jgi:toxin secretion/phage lysis holin|nr:MAG TPA: holin [Caudoviricetes sp.]
MDKMLNWISILAGCVGGVTASLLGGCDILLQALVAVVVLDYITGIIKAVYQKRLSSEIGFRGLLKKVLIFIVVAAANVLEWFVAEEIALREIVMMFFLSNEILSLLENAAIFIPIPKELKNVLLQLRNGKDDT